MAITDYIEYRVLRTLVESHLNIPFTNYIVQLKEAVSESDKSPKHIIKSCLSKVTTPEKLAQILNEEQMKSYFNELSYDPSTKELTYKNNKLSGLTKLLTLLWAIVFYSMSTKEELKDVSSPYIEKSVEYVKGMVTSKCLLSSENINIEILNEIFNKPFSTLPLCGLVCYVTTLSLFSEKMSVVMFSHLSRLLVDVGDSFGLNIYYMLIKARALTNKNIYIEFLADEVYNNLYAVGMVQTPLSVLKAKIASFPETSMSKEEVKQ